MSNSKLDGAAVKDIGESGVGIGDLAALSLGAAVLGTGGGGNPYSGRLALKRCIERFGREPKLKSLDSLPDDALIVSVGMSGSPSVGMEKLIAESYATRAVRRLETLIRRRVDAIMPLEVGGVNSLLPLMSGCATDLPVIDADGMGRAFPTLDKTTFHIGGVAQCPSVLVNAHDDVFIFFHAMPTRIRESEKIRRAAIVAMGGACVAAHYPMTGRQAKATAIPRTMTLALGIGREIFAARESKSDPFQAIFVLMARHDPTSFGGVLFDGKVVDLERNMVGGYNIGMGSLEGLEGWKGTLSFAFQNEFLYVKRNGRLLAIVPDLIAFLDRETAEPVTCETLRYGQRVKVIGLSASPALRTPAALKVCGPAGFQLADQYVPIERLAG